MLPSEEQQLKYIQIIRLYKEKVYKIPTNKNIHSRPAFVKSAVRKVPQADKQGKLIKRG